MLPTYGQEATVKSALAAVMFLVFSMTVAGQETSELSTPPNGDNEHAEVSQWIGPVKISIDYHSPKVHNPANNDRTGHIWREVVHYGFVDEGFGPTKGAPWRAGANESTSITFSNDVKVEGKDLKPEQQNSSVRGRAEEAERRQLRSEASRRAGHKQRSESRAERRLRQDRRSGIATSSRPVAFELLAILPSQLLLSLSDREGRPLKTGTNGRMRFVSVSWSYWRAGHLMANSQIGNANPDAGALIC
jgi:Protein of unknown function (DUF2911)